MTYTKQIFGISLALVMLLGSVPLGFSEPLRVQLEQGIEQNQIQCNNDSHVLVLRTNGNMACVSEKSAERMGWEIIKTDIKVLENPVELSNESLKPENVIFGTTTAMANESENMASMGGSCSDFPKNLSIQFPNAVRLDEEFDVIVSYTFIAWADEDIAESEITGVPLPLSDAEYRLDEPREPIEGADERYSGCLDTTIVMRHSDKLSTLNENMELYDSFTFSDTHKIKNTSFEEIPFNNTEPQTKTLTLRYDELPDRYDSKITIGKMGNMVSIYHYVENEIIYLLPNYPNSSELYENTSTSSSVEGTSLQSTFTLLEVESSNFFTEKIEMFTNEIEMPEVDNAEFTFPPMKEFAEFLTLTVEPENLVAWLENEERLTSEYIEELLETYFPNVIAQFLLFFNFDIPLAFGAPNDLVIIYGNTGHHELSINPIDIPFNEVTICAYDRDEDTGVDELLYYGLDPVCDITEDEGSFSLIGYKDDTNDSIGSDYIDLVLYVFPKNDYFEFVQDIDPDNFDDVKSISQAFTYLTRIVSDSSFYELEVFMNDNDSHFLHSIEILEQMQVSKDFIKSEYSYDINKVFVNYDEGNCKVTYYEPDAFAPDKVIFLADNQAVNCNSHEMYESDTPKHEYYHFYTDEIYTEKNGGVLPDYSNWGTHYPAISIPEDQAWFEGIASAFVLMEKEGLSVTNPYEYQTVYYYDPFDYEDGGSMIDRHGNTLPFVDGITGEGAITKFIYDLVDNTPSEIGNDADKIDKINLSASQVNNIFDDELNDDVGETQVAFDVLDFVSDWNDETGFPDINNVLFLNTLITEMPVDDPVDESDYLGNLIFEADFTSDSTILADWILSGDEDWEADYKAVNNENTRIIASDNCDDYCIMTLDGYLALEDYTELYLNFWYNVDTYTSDDEGLKVEISLNNGNTWEEILSFDADNGYNTGEWVEIKNYDILEYAGFAFKIQFTAKSSSSLDDIMLANLQIRGIEDTSGGGGGSSDSDNDGITDNIDTGNDTFSDGTTSGVITDRGGQSVSISDDSSDGVIITTTSTESNALAHIDLCDNKGTLSMNNGDSVIATCGSVILEENGGSGSFGVSLESDNEETFTTRLSDDEKLTFDEVAPSISNESDVNSIDITHNGVTLTLDAGNTITVPSTPFISVLSQSDTLVNLEWLVVDDGGTSITGYTVEYSIDETNWTSIGSDITSIEIDNLDSVTYYFRVVAENFMGSSEYSITQSLTVIAVDITAPEITVPDNQTFEATAMLTPLNSIHYGIATATDDIDSNPVITNNSTGFFPLGETVITWTATDFSNNFATAKQTITITDNTKPVFSVEGQVMFKGWGEVPKHTWTFDEIFIDEITCIDLVDGDITSKLYVENFGTLNVNREGSSDLYAYYCEDNSGNYDWTVRIVVVDKNPDRQSNVNFEAQVGDSKVTFTWVIDDNLNYKITSNDGGSPIKEHNASDSPYTIEHLSNDVDYTFCLEELKNTEQKFKECIDVTPRSYLQ